MNEYVQPMVTITDRVVHSRRTCTETRPHVGRPPALTGRPTSTYLGLLSDRAPSQRFAEQSHAMAATKMSAMTSRLRQETTVDDVIR